MTVLKLYYATNRNHIGKDRWAPDSYGKTFSSDGMKNLRFGSLAVDVDKKKVDKYLTEEVKDCGVGSGDDLSGYLKDCAESASISAYTEVIDKELPEEVQENIKLGSKAMFSDIQKDMVNSSDVLVYIHGFNVDWFDAVGAALALQTMLRSKGDDNQNVVVILFSWPSNGSAMPWVAYNSDKEEAKGSAMSFARGLMKTRDFLIGLRDKAREGGSKLCGQDMHLLCHSMGNYVLGNALTKIDGLTPGDSLPRLFEHVFLCAPDVNDTALESGQLLGKIDNLARNVTVYHNRGDAAMFISDHSKGQPERLGGAGAAHPNSLHSKVYQVDCTPIVHGIVEHSYYLVGNVLADIRASIDGAEQNDEARLRVNTGMQHNVWAMKK